MKFQSLAAVAITLFYAGLTVASPHDAALVVHQDKRGTEQINGLGARKQQVVAAGGNTRDLAIAMLET
jgi:hypothetical protein